ncbi:protein maelstrom homolog [Rhipicephalus microplus]|uniref:protein maelstrom homolog n=1 Tax=Rhipicephalus microplus TaxID=6941 RepID=UPI003F6D190B
MAPKKKGPFYFLLLELQKERRERNLPFSLDAVREEAGERWKSLTEQQKAHYEALANRHKEMKVGSLENKLTSDGRTIASVLREQSEEINQRKEMVASIQRYVDDIGTVDEIKKFPFYILATNILCEANGVYYPLEIGLIEYSIEQGFIRAYHKFINPGRIPLGFASAAKDHSEDTHGIPITGFDLGTTNYWAVVQDLMAYLRLTQDDPVLPPFFCMPHHMPQAEGVLRWLEEHARCELDFPIWDIEMLLRKLRSVVGEDISHAEAENILSSALFDYELKSLCQYHMEIDNKNCALGEARRLGFKMSNALVNAYRVERIIEYQHLPPRYDPSLTFEVSQMNLRPTPRGGSSRRPIGGSGDPGSYNRSNYAGAAPPLQREPRRPEDYYGESRGPRVVRNPQPGPSTAGAAAASVDTLVDDFPSLGESMLGRKPPPGYFNYSSSTQSPNESDTDSFTTECSISSGARPKTTGAAAARRSVASSLAAQFTTLAPTEQGIGRGAPVAGPSHVQSPGGNSFFQMPRQPRTEPAYIKIRKPSDDPVGGKGMGRGNF